MAGSTSRYDGRGHDPSPVPDPLHASKVLGGPVDFAPSPEEKNHLDARFALEMDVRRRTDVFPPPVFGRRETTQDIRGVVPVEQEETTDGVRLRVRQLFLPQLLADESSHRVGSARRVPLLDPTVESGQKLRFHRESKTDDSLRHGRAIRPNPKMASLTPPRKRR